MQLYNTIQNEVWQVRSILYTLIYIITEIFLKRATTNYADKMKY